MMTRQGRRAHSCEAFARLLSFSFRRLCKSSSTASLPQARNMPETKVRDPFSEWHTGLVVVLFVFSTMPVIYLDMSRRWDSRKNERPCHRGDQLWDGSLGSLLFERERKSST
jgi:hypothetical protein